MPKNHICVHRQRIVVKIGLHGKVVITCKIHGILKGDICDIKESNKTTMLILTNCSHIEFRGALHQIAHQDIYEIIDPIIAIAYRKENNYKQSQSFIVKNAEQEFQHCRQGGEFLAFASDPWFEMILLMCAPGPHILWLKEVCSPTIGIVRSGMGHTTFHEILGTFVRPPCSDINLGHYYFYHFDGSLLHLVRSPRKTANMKEYFTSVKMYRRVMS
jgi:hypothetical protein